MSDAQHQKRLKQMEMKILYLERENLKTQAKSTAEMVERIRQIIMDEARKIYGGNRNVD